MAKMMAWSILGMVFAGLLQQASAARQLQQVLPALAGTPTWAPAASYSNMRIVMPLPTTTPILGPNGVAMPNLAPPLGVISSASNMRMAGTAAPVIPLPLGFTAAAAPAAPRRTIPEYELERPRFVDNTKLIVGNNGIKVAGTGLSTPAGATNTLPRSTLPSIQSAPGAGAAAAVTRISSMPYNQALPSIPNLPVKPPMLIFDSMVPMPAELPYLSPAAQQQQQQQQQQPQQQAAGQTLGQLTQRTAQMVQQQLSNPSEQLQRLAAAASEGNLARFIQDTGRMVTENIQNVTAAANSLIAATNNIYESLPRNLTIPGELAKLINSTTLQLPKLPSLNPAQIPSMARLAGAASLPGAPQLPSLSNLFSGIQSLGLPRLPGLGSTVFSAFNPAAAAAGAAAQNVAAAAVPAPNYYAQDVFGVAAVNSNGEGNANHQASASGSPDAMASAAAAVPMSDVERRARAAAQKAQAAVAAATGAALPAHNAAAVPATSAHDGAQQAAAATRRANAGSNAATRAAQQRQARSARAKAALQSGGGFKVVDGQLVPAAQ